MRDLEYLNSIYESLDEGIGIKTTKLKPFYDAANAYDSQRNPSTKHNELARSYRRTVRYDYGHANYEEISAEEALRLIKQDKYNVQKLRIIYDLSDKYSLVEYEVRDNGSIYAIYGSPTPVTIAGRAYKNIRYASYKTVIENADIIYITDEYDKYLNADPEAARARAERTGYVQLPSYADKTAPGYDPHHLYANAYFQGSTDYSGKKGRFVTTNPDTGAHDIEQRYHRTVLSVIRPYVDLQKEVKQTYEELDRYRRALKKLEKEKDEIGEDEYAQKKARWTEAYNRILADYTDKIKTLHAMGDKIDKQIDDKSAAFAKKLHDNILQYDEALRRGFELSEQIQLLKSRLVGDLAAYASDYSISSTCRDASRRLETLAKQLTSAKKSLEEILANAEANPNSVSTAQDNVIAAANAFEEQLSAVDALRLGELDKHLKQIDEIANQLQELDITLARLRPKTAAARQARAAKNKTAELDPELVDIIDFGEDSEDNTEEDSES